MAGVKHHLAQRHRDRFERARRACRERGHWSPFPEMPADYPDSEAAQAAGRAAFEVRVGQRFALPQPAEIGWLGEEVSPYTREPLGVRYPQCDTDALFDAAERAMTDWARAPAEVRIGVLMEVIERIYRRVFELANAVMHTTGQSFNMSYAGSGVNALDRGIEALVLAWEAMQQVPETAHWQRRFGKAEIRLAKRYRIVPRGVAVCFTCASFPTWNAYPSMMASLATGNAVLVKPHPGAVLPMALSVEICREVLAEAGFNPDLVLLAPDSTDAPLGKVLVKHPKTAIVDFTGSTAFGQWVERNSHPALCFTETAGVNTVVLESCEDLDAVLKALATSLSLFSAQMCTSPQNIYVPRNGVKVAGRQVSFDKVAAGLAAAVHQLVSDPRKAAMILAAIQSESSLGMLEAMAQQGKVLLASQPYAHPDYPKARTATPLILEVDTAQRELYLQERFGPVSFVIACDSAADALTQATTDVRAAGGLTAFVYSTDAAFLSAAEDLYARAGAQLTCNLTGPMPLNFAAAYSDYHVTALNGAGNASLTNLAFVAGRFGIAQSRGPVAAAGTEPA